VSASEAEKPRLALADDGAAILLVSAPGTPRAPAKYGWWDAVFLFY
jgi:hypothetical protein